MKNEMKPYPQITFRYCFTGSFLEAVKVGEAFRSEYPNLPGSECVYSLTYGDYYAKCTRGGNISITCIVTHARVKAKA